MENRFQEPEESPVGDVERAQDCQPEDQPTVNAEEAEDFQPETQLSVEERLLNGDLEIEFESEPVEFGGEA